MYYLYWSLSFPLIHKKTSSKSYNLYLPRLAESAASYQENTYNEDVNRRTIEISQPTPIFEAGHCLKVHSVPLKLALSISRKGSIIVKN